MFVRLLEDTYSWHKLGFFQPKKSVIWAELLPPSSALVAEVLLKLKTNCQLVEDEDKLLIS